MTEGSPKEPDEMMSHWRMNWKFLAPVEFKGFPRQENSDTIFERGAELARHIKRRT
jgi:hypothetical protein